MLRTSTTTGAWIRLGSRKHLSKSRRGPAERIPLPWPSSLSNLGMAVALNERRASAQSCIPADNSILNGSARKLAGRWAGPPIPRSRPFDDRSPAGAERPPTIPYRAKTSGDTKKQSRSCYVMRRSLTIAVVTLDRPRPLLHCGQRRVSLAGDGIARKRVTQKNDTGTWDSSLLVQRRRCVPEAQS